VTPSTLTGIAACCTGVLMAMSPLLQIRRIRITDDAVGVSGGVFAVMALNASVWIVHGLITGDPVLVVPNAVGLVTACGTVLFIRHHGRRIPKIPANRPVDISSCGG
jgi:uncharacterized membrane protein YGL010W